MECRDCSRCTERAVVAASLGWVRVLWAFTLIPFFLNLFRKKCPYCGHPVAWHHYQ